MIYEVELIVDSRSTARIVAKQLVSLHLVSSAEITMCDMVEVLYGEIAEKSITKITCLTTRPNSLKAIGEAFKQENIPISFDNIKIRPTNIDEATIKKCIDWCGEDLTASTGLTDSKDMNNKRTNTAELREQRKTRRAKKEAVQQEIAELSEGLTETETKAKTARKLPKWAEEQGYTFTEYNTINNWRTAARWGMTYPEYSRALIDAKILGIPPKKYLTRIGKTHNPDLDTSFVTLEYIERMRNAAKEGTTSDAKTDTTTESD